MLLYLLAFAGGILTIVSPCILPVLPFVFSRAGQSFRRSGLPLLAGMAITFALVAAVATVAGAWVVRANEIGRILALVIFAVLGLALLFSGLSEYLSRPFVRLGGRVGGATDQAPSIGKSLLLGVSTGLLWTPCAGPILGLILTGAAVAGANAHTALLLVAFAAGAGCSLAVALLAENKAFALMKRSLGAEKWIRRGLGAAVLLGVVAIAFGWDQGVLQRISLASTSGIEQSLIDHIRPVASAQVRTAQGAPVMTAMAAQTDHVPLGNEGSFPSLDGAVAWLNSAPLTSGGLKGKVVLIDFWTYSCINCLRAIPYVEAWSQKYKKDGLVVIGVHTPEFAFEKDRRNVAKAVSELKITYPVAIDSNYAIWNAFHNEYWPAHYFIDVYGTIRYHHFGEGEYDKSEQVIQQLLKEKNASLQASGAVQVSASGAEAEADFGDIQSPETYIGYARQQNYVSPEEIKRNAAGVYTAPGRLDVNDWGLAGRWNVSGQQATLLGAPGKIIFRFHARDLHLVCSVPERTARPSAFACCSMGPRPRRPRSGRGRPGKRDREGVSPLPVDPAEGQGRRPNISNRVSGSRCAGVCIYIRIISAREVAMSEFSMSGDRSSQLVGRRVFLAVSGAALAGFALRRMAPIQADAASWGRPKLVTIVEFTNDGVRKDVISVPMIQKTDVQWKAQLSAASFEVARHAATEQPFTGSLLNIHDKGVFRCICCDTALFNSATKFESGTGWPSFWEPIAKENVVESSDYSFGLRRTAVSCRRCDAHLGHVFDDGPRPTGLRYCMNSVALKFAKG